VRVSCRVTCTVTGRLTVSNALARRLGLAVGRRTLGSLTRTLTPNVRHRVTIRVPAARLAVARFQGLRRINATVAVTVTHTGGSRRSVRQAVSITP
jgi:hypothetical protein